MDGQGNHSRVRRPHHGIGCGNGYVIHYTKDGRGVERISKSLFLNGGKEEVVNLWSIYLPDEVIVIEKAEDRLGETEYSLLFNSYEHLSNWCRSGQVVSGQVDEVIDWLSERGNDSVLGNIGMLAIGVAGVYEVGELSPKLQVKLLRFMQDQNRRTLVQKVKYNNYCEFILFTYTICHGKEI